MAFENCCLLCVTSNVSPVEFGIDQMPMFLDREPQSAREAELRRCR